MNLWRKIRYYPLATMVLFLGFTFGITFSSLGIAGIFAHQTITTPTMPINNARIVSFTSQRPFSLAELFQILKRDGMGGEYLFQFTTSLQFHQGEVSKRGVVDAIFVQGPLLWQPPLQGKVMKQVFQSNALRHQIFLPSSVLRASAKINLWGRDYSVIGYLNAQQFNFPLVSVSQIPHYVLDRKVYEESVQFFAQNPYLSQKKLYLGAQHAGIEVSFSHFTSDGNAASMASASSTAVIGVVTLLVSVINLINSGLFWVSDRHQEIAVKRLVGAKRSSIIGMILFDLLIICLVAAFLSFAVDLILSHLWAWFTGVILPSFWVIWGIALVIAIFSGLLASFIPVLKALRISPSEALKKW
nr:ABC transporter permease [Bacilli bacterium]